MEAEQIILPFRLVSRIAIEKKQPNGDLIGRSFFDGPAQVSVVSVCHANPNQVMVQRDVDGKSWSVPAGVIRLIVGQKKKRRVA